MTARTASPVSSPPAPDTTLTSPGSRRLNPAVFQEVVLHLVRREIDATHRMTVLGWAWPVARQVAQLAALVFIFGSVLDLGIPHFPVFVFSGLIAWTWFSTGIGTAATVLLDERHLVFQPRLPSAVLPIVAIVVPLVDVLLALPVLILLAVLERGLEWTALLTPLLVILQLLLMTGIAWLVSSVSVFFRDVPNLTQVVLQILFYMTPVFYGLRTVPDEYEPILHANPMTTMVEAYRAALLGDPWPSATQFIYVGVLSLVLCVIGYLTFRRLSRDFADNL
ncbi:ABC transporter permease [Baekduia sp. Peel2402]|uniref:ABC transporter permease n=1 Tax=Baekduia sp. Peel2402 TaxID=3458296 RepID=UPI00403E53D0